MKICLNGTYCYYALPINQQNSNPLAYEIKVEGEHITNTALSETIRWNIDKNNDKILTIYPSTMQDKWLYLHDDKYLRVGTKTTDHNFIIQQDFFELDITQFIGRKVLTIGNPPFGVQNNLAIRFFNKAAQYSDTIAFILPKSFMKESVQNKLDLRFHLDKYIELPYKSFSLNGEDYGVNCVFQIWRKREMKRTVGNKNIDDRYIKFSNINDFDFIIRRVG